MVPYDPVQDDRYRIARFVCARWLRHAQPTGAPRANTRNPSIRRGCRDRVSEVEILTTVVATVFRSIRAKAASPAIFRRACSIHRPTLMQLQLPFSLDGCRASSLRVLCQPQQETAFSPAPSGDLRDRRACSKMQQDNPNHDTDSNGNTRAGEGWPAIRAHPNARRGGGVKGGTAAEGHP